MHLELGQRPGDLIHVFCGQYKFGGFDVLVKVLHIAGSGDRNDERPLGPQSTQRSPGCGPRVFVLLQMGKREVCASCVRRQPLSDSAAIVTGDERD